MRTFAAAVLAACCAVSASAAELRYTLTPEVEHGALRAIGVELVLRGEGDGSTEIELPNEWGGKSELWRGVSEFRVSGDGLRQGDGGSPFLKVLRHKPGATLTVRYRITQFWQGEPAVSGSNEYRPIVQPGYFQIIGWTAFVRPRWSLATSASVSFRGLAPGWRLASDLEHDPRSLTLARVLESVSVGGDFRVTKAGALRVAMRGTWPFSDADFVQRLEPIFASHNRFWGDEPQPYLVTVLPLVSETGSMSLGGTGLGDAFAFFATGNVQDRDLTRVLAHEHLHSWIPRRIGMMPQDNDAAEYWLSEGFTDFYTNRLLVRDGLWSVEDVVRALNEVMWAYAFSPVRNAPNAKLAAEFWKSQAMNELPYQRGLLIAALADDRVWRSSGGAHDLDDVMLAMKRTVDGAAAPRPAIREHFVARMKEHGVDFSPDISRFVEKGETVLLPADVWAPCGTLWTGEVAEFDRGFDGRKTIANKNAVVGVDPTGPAYAAGLRDGMRIRSLDLSLGRDSRVPLTYQVLLEGGGVRDISYLPAGKRKVTLQELTLKTFADTSARAACAARLGGDSGVASAAR
jgi:predicted metalloprotease with PDZ domain